MAKGKKLQMQFEPDAWQRFERAVKVVAKSPPQPKKKKSARRKKPDKSK